MLNRLDDCSRLFTGSKLYQHENLLAYFDFLPAAFLAYSLPLELYVDFHSVVIGEEVAMSGGRVVYRLAFDGEKWCVTGKRLMWES